MADVVQFRLERMVDELDDLERKGIFSRREIAEIVKKRRNFEYRLKRPSPLKQDYLSYIDYEKQLDSLRALRKKSIVREFKKSNTHKKWKKSVSDIASVIRTLEIYRLAVVRYKGDIDLWFRYLEFCREHGHRRMKQVLAQVLRFHPKVPGLWIYAAAWEFDHNLNVSAARALMQSGLRACPNSEDLWVEYLRMELTYLNKLKARKAALGEDIGTLAPEGRDGEDNQWKEENQDLFMPLNEERENVDGGTDSHGGDTEEKVDAFQEQGSSVFRTIYNGAVESIPSSMSLRKRFLEILNETDLAHSDDLKEEIMENMKKDFSSEESYWDWLARLQIVDFKIRMEMPKEFLLLQLNKAVQVYEEALNIVPSAKMFSFYARFWSDVIIPEREHSENSADFTSHLLKVYEKAESKGCMTEDLAHQYTSLFLQLGRLEEARQLAEKFCNGELSGAAKLWILRVSIEMKWVTMKSASLSKDDLQSIFKLMECVSRKIAISEGESLWLMAIKFFSKQKEYFEKLVQSILIVMARGGGTESGFALSSAVVNWVLQKDGIQRAREMYKRFLSLPHPSLSIYRHCIELESNLAFVGSKDGLVNSRKLYESALSIYDQNVELWQDYYSLEKKVGTSETTSAVYWRARKTLKDGAGLVGPCNL
ncbi:U3 small nucleolar RNA-associated-like protein [Tasmannia lanceolata]|uniref:U3 small nucleolar RNA-associated-like protein n=1 Tax=Tasmannia lanceolata TaxID=3420 RepID=UPI00406345E4